SGVYVSRTDDALVVASQDYGGTVDKKLLLDLVEARIPIEVSAVAAAAVNSTDEQLATMRRLLDEASEHLDDDELLSAANMAFHQEIAVASGNRVLAQLLEVLRNLFHREQRMILDIYGSRQQDHEHHLDILDALERRDEKLAVARMQAHLE